MAVADVGADVLSWSEINILNITHYDYQFIILLIILIYFIFIPVCIGNEYIVSVNLSFVVNARTLTRYIVPGFNGPLQYCDDNNLPPVIAFVLQ